MVELSLIEKIKTLFTLIFSSSLFLILLLGIFIILVDIFYISKQSKKVKIMYLFVSIVVLGILLITYFEEFLKFVDVLNKNIVMLINFPSLLQYTVIIFITLIIMIISVFNKKINRIITRINIGVFVADLFIFFLILDQISKANIDLSNKVNIYSNTNLMVLFEISMIIFVIWLLGLSIYKICSKLISKNKGNNILLENNLPSSKKIEETNKIDGEEEELELPKRKEDGTIVNLYEEPEMPRTIEELRKEKVLENLTKKFDDNIYLTNGLFTVEECKELSKLLHEMQKNKKA